MSSTETEEIVHVEAMQTGTPYETNASVMLIDRVRRSADRVAAVMLGEYEMTYRQLGERIRATKALLSALGLGRGDRLAFAAGNTSEVLEYMVAALHLGAVFVPLNTRLNAVELRDIITDAGARIVVADAAMAGVIDAERSAIAARLVAIGDPSSVPAGWEAAEELLPSDPPALGPAAETDVDDVAILMYTSGTTGRAKGAMISHGNLISTVHNLLLLLPSGADAGMLAMAPIFHVGAMALVLGTLATGGRVVILRTFDPKAVFDAIETQPVTFSFGVPAMLQAMAAEPRFPTTDLSHVLLMCAGAPVPESLLDLYIERGAAITQGYGLTESTAVVSLLEADEASTKIGSAGMPYPLTAVEIRDPEGRPIDDAGVDGEIWIKGRNVVAGYWNRPEETAALRDENGWLRTGDAGHFDADGYLYITDRIKDMLISGGENVYPAEVEKVLAAHPDIADVAVVGTPDERWGEVVTAVVVARPGAEVDLDSVQTFARTQLGGYKVPRRLELVAELPRNASGKVLKRDLRDSIS